MVKHFLPCEVLCHQIGRVIISFHLEQRVVFPFESLMHPQRVDSYVALGAEPDSLTDALCCTAVCVDA